MYVRFLFGCLVMVLVCLGLDKMPKCQMCVIWIALAYEQKHQRKYILHGIMEKRKQSYHVKSNGKIERSFWIKVNLLRGECCS